MSALAVLLAVSSLQAPSTESAAQSLMFRGDPSHQGVSSARFFGGQGGIKWRAQTGDAVRATAAVTTTRVFIGSADGNLYAFDRATGRVIWKHAAGSPVNGSPAIGGRLVVAATADGIIFAVDRETGRRHWTVRTGAALPLNAERAAGWDFYVSSPTIVGQSVVIGSQDGGIYALDLATGRQRWRLQTKGRVRATAAVKNGVVIVGSFDGRLYALDLATGHERWVHRTEGDTLDSRRWGFDRRAIQSSAAIDSATVYFGSRDGALYAVDFATGERRWRFSHRGSWVVGSPAVKDGRVYVGSSDGHFVQAVDAKAGTEVWRYEAHANVLSSPLLIGDALVVGTLRTDVPAGELIALDQATGGLRWHYRLDPAVLSSPVAADGELYVGADDGSVVAFEEVSPQVPRLAVFYDSALARTARVPAPLALEYFRAAGYDVLDAAGLGVFLPDRIVDRLPSAIVFAVDQLPASVAPTAADSVPFRKYLEAGGKVVWLGEPVNAEVKNEKGETTAFDPHRTERLLGVSYGGMDFDVYAGRPTPTGRQWGLTAPERSNYPMANLSECTALALDPFGRAVAWVRVYRRDRPGSGFVQLWGMGATADRLEDIRRVAEYGLLRKS
jgi:outer membrane protein assembly factor BamB